MLKSVETPEKVGFSASRLARIDKVMQGYVEEGKLAGMIALVARHGQVAYCKNFGWMDVEAAEPMAMNAIFRIFSMSKPITSVALMMLYEQGKFQLNDPVAKYIPAFANLKVFKKQKDKGMKVEDLDCPITIWNLLTHTSGLSYGFDDHPVDALYREQKMLRLDETLEDKIARLVELPLRHQPNTIWHYSMATDVLGYIMQLVSGMDFATYLQEKVFAPLGMTDTAFYVPADKLDRLAAVYTSDKQAGLIRLGTEATKQELGDDYINKDREPEFPSGGGGLVSTTTDYFHFAEMLRRRGEYNGVRLLGSRTVDYMATNQLPASIPMPDNPGMRFGLGFGVITDTAQTHILNSPGSYGWGGAANTHYWVDPHEDLVAILMLQCLPGGIYPVNEQFRILTYQALVE
ncbi:MAG: serine hydrolase [Anaerolineae bacterium]|nr:serine hydrolase [Anaerolineae bacterium]